MSGNNGLSAAARLHVVKADPSDDIESPSTQAQGSQGKGKAKAQVKGKAKNKGKGKAKGNPVRDGSPVSAPARELAGSRHGADHWDDLRRAWAGYLSQSKKGGQGTHQPHQTPKNHQQPRAGQKRKATATNNGTADDGEHKHAAKRQKSDARAPGLGAGAAGAAQRHPDFWHPDGSVVVEVEKTKFRLHQSTLQKHSTYFAAAFREKEGHRNGGRAYLEVEVDERGPNGHLPVYRVSETTADDFASLLTVIEEPMKYGDEPPPMPVLAGALRAARALSFDAQRKWAERMLERTWPATLDALTADPMPHAGVALARTCGLRGVQKRASYELLRIPTFGQAIAGAGAAAEAEKEKGGTGADAEAEAGWGGLCEMRRADLLRFLHARELLGLAWAEVAGVAPTDFACPRGAQTQLQMQQPERGGAGSGCASANVDRVHARWAELVHSSGLYVQRMVDPLMGLQDLVGIAWKDEGFCKKCVAARRNAWGELRRTLWDDLDVWLELNVEEVD